MLTCDTANDTNKIVSSVNLTSNWLLFRYKNRRQCHGACGCFRFFKSIEAEKTRMHWNGTRIPRTPHAVRNTCFLVLDFCLCSARTPVSWIVMNDVLSDIISDSRRFPSIFALKNKNSTETFSQTRYLSQTPHTCGRFRFGRTSPSLTICIMQLVHSTYCSLLSPITTCAEDEANDHSMKIEQTNQL